MKEEIVPLEDRHTKLKNRKLKTVGEGGGVSLEERKIPNQRAGKILSWPECRSENTNGHRKQEYLLGETGEDLLDTTANGS